MTIRSHYKKLCVLLIGTFSIFCLSNHPYASDLIIPTDTWPHQSGSTIQIDQQYLQEKANIYCEAPINPGNTVIKNSEDFIMGSLAIDAFNDICDLSDVETKKSLGNLYVSGMLGGIWLRNAVRHSEAEITAVHALLQTNATIAAGFGYRQSLIYKHFPNLAFKAWDNLATAVLNLSDQSLTDQTQALSRTLPVFLFITGYNKGYLDQILAYPPDNVAPPVNYIECTHFLDCQRPGLALAPFEQYAYVIDDLNDIGNQDPKWQRMNWRINLFGENSLAAGARVWKLISVKRMRPEAYNLLIDLSAKFLMISEVSLLAAMAAINESDPEAGRCAIRQQAAMLVWMGSYFTGLASARPARSFATLHCTN